MLWTWTSGQGLPKHTFLSILWGPSWLLYMWELFKNYPSEKNLTTQAYIAGHQRYTISDPKIITQEVKFLLTSKEIQPGRNRFQLPWGFRSSGAPLSSPRCTPSSRSSWRGKGSAQPNDHVNWKCGGSCKNLSISKRATQDHATNTTYHSYCTQFPNSRMERGLQTKKQAWPQKRLVSYIGLTTVL